jgi:cobyrinic acid a,c-diamide synthase
VTHAQLSRVVIAGLSGDAGKSVTAIGLTGALKRRGLRVAPFKKGPDFIDAGWLGAAAGVPGRNLDTFMMPQAAVIGSLCRAAAASDIAVIEGNRGLFDGADSCGTHSTAQLAKLIEAPVVLVLDATKATRTLAALVLGCRAMDESLSIAGVILNRVRTARHESVIRTAIADVTGVPVIGAIPRLAALELPSRHLGLVTALEQDDSAGVVARIAEAVEDYVDLDAVVKIAGTAADLVVPTRPSPDTVGHARVGVLRDEAFTFYYPENLEALATAGAEIVWISPLRDRELPDVDALYAGGGFPEEFAQDLAANHALRQALAERIDQGLPVWAECGGLMYLSGGIWKDGSLHAMVGALPMTVEHNARPQGHGYVAGHVDAKNPFLPEGFVLAGHEFHYSRLRPGAERLDTVVALDRGVGVGLGRDGVHSRNVVATYTHLHALGVPDWAPALVRAARGAAA